jgi:hypothetical protein
MLAKRVIMREKNPIIAHTTQIVFSLAGFQMVAAKPIDPGQTIKELGGDEFYITYLNVERALPVRRELQPWHLLLIAMDGGLPLHLVTTPMA